MGMMEDFPDNSATMELKRAYQFLLHSDEPELRPSKKQAVEAAQIRKPESRINNSSELSCKCPFDIELAQVVPNQSTDQLSVVIEGSAVLMSQDDSSVSLSVSLNAMEDQEAYCMDGGNAPLGHSSDVTGTNVRSMDLSNADGIHKNTSRTRSYSKKKSDKVSMDEYQKSIIALLESPVSSYSLLYEQSSLLTSKSPMKDNSATKKRVDTKAVRKEVTNVRMLLGTGMLDGKQVRYTTASGQELLHGTIKGSGYLCGCQSCNYSKEFNANEFERHAGCKTSHPNNHIYLVENGKSMHQIVQELKNTPLSMLSEFDVPSSNTTSSKSQDTLKLDAPPKINPKTKSAIKETYDSFPSTVKILTMTGMFDGVPVKYSSSSQEGLVTGIIEGARYLCGCQSCNYLTAVSALQFELHAGCKTSHPNNHIYFENGKTIHQIVQELKNTPRDLLFDTIRTVTGSPINEKAFCIWKESFIAGNRELRCTYEMESKICGRIGDQHKMLFDR